MGDNHNILATLNFHDYRLKADNNVAVALAALVAVIVFVVIASFEIVWIALLNLLVRQSVANTRVQLIERFPLFLCVGQVLRSLYCAFHG